MQRVVNLALSPPPGEATHWTGRLLAKAAGVSLRSVQRILEAHQLAPHCIRTFKLSNDPKFAEKLQDIAGLYVDPPDHAVVLAVDEKSKIQALDRSQPGSGRCARHRSTRRTGRSARWRRKLAFPTPRSAGCGWRSACSHTVVRRSSCRTIRRSSTRYAISSAFTFPHPTEPSSSASMRKTDPGARSRAASLADDAGCT